MMESSGAPPYSTPDIWLARNEQLQTEIATVQERVKALEGALAQEHIDRSEAVAALSPEAADHVVKVHVRDFAAFAASCPTCAALSAGSLPADAPAEPKRGEEVSPPTRAQWDDFIEELIGHGYVPGDAESAVKAGRRLLQESAQPAPSEATS